MARPKLNPRRAILVRLDEELYAELMLLRPDMRNFEGYTKYGAWNSYISNLVRRDVENLKDAIRLHAGPTTGDFSS